MTSSPTTLDYANKRPERPTSMGLHWFAVGLACATLLLIVAGAVVTSTGSGLSVPDWPTTYGHSMFTFPIDKWVGGIFYEHGHRLIASTIGFLTIVLAIWLHRREPRRWVRLLGFAALGSVILQGVLGGLTVLYFLPTAISVLHGCLAQAFFCMVILIAVVTSPHWRRPSTPIDATAGTRRLCIAAVAVVSVQLLLGAVMRHTESGLAVLDFPLAYGQVIPDLSAEAVDQYNEQRRFDHFVPVVTVEQIAYHMAHRVGAVVVTIVLLWTSVAMLRRHPMVASLRRPAMAIVVLLAIQLFLGAMTIWSSRAPSLASAHVAVGAAILGTTWILMLHAFRYLHVDRVRRPDAPTIGQAATA